MNTAVKHLQDQAVVTSPRRQSQQQTPKKVLIKKEVRRAKKDLYSITNLGISLMVGVFLIVMVQLALDARLNAIHYETQMLKFEMEQQSVKNEELYSKIAELSTYSRAMEISKANGLKTQGNIVFIGE